MLDGDNSAKLNTPWKTGEVVLATFAMLIGYLAISIVAAVLISFGGYSVESAPIVILSIAMTGVLLLLVSSVFGPMKYRMSIRELGFKLPNNRGVSQYLLPIVIAGAIVIFNVAYVGLVSVFDWTVLIPPPVPIEIGFTPLSLIVTGILVIVVGPLAEEVFFRGFLLPGLSKRFTMIGAVIISSILFAGFHGVIGLFIPAFFAGVLFAYLYVRGGTIHGCFLAHSAQNALAFSIAVIAL